jgi:uncharacterized hydantoinase/oxoprolinase family protein
MRKQQFDSAWEYFLILFIIPECKGFVCLYSMVELIAKDLIEQYFPELKDVFITFKKVSKTDYFASVSGSRNNYHINYHRKLLKGSKAAIKGCLAHELQHIVEFRKHSLIRRLINRLQTSKTERRIDTAVVSRGLGKELLAFQRFHDKYYEPYDESDGLTRKEIKRLL